MTESFYLSRIKIEKQGQKQKKIVSKGNGIFKNQDNAVTQNKKYYI